MSIFEKNAGVERLERTETDVIEVESDFNRVFDDLKATLSKVEHDSEELHELLQRFFKANCEILQEISPRTFFDRPVKHILPLVRNRLELLAEVRDKLGTVGKGYIDEEKTAWHAVQNVADKYLINTGQELMEKEWERLKLPLHKISQCIHHENHAVMTKYEPEVKRIMGDVSGAKQIEDFLGASKKTIERLQQEIEQLAK